MTPPVHASLATYKPRYGLARKTIRALAPQVDTVRVYVNDEPGERPNWAEHVPENTSLYFATEYRGTLGDVGKFFPLQFIHGSSYVLLCDDDLNYPPDYADRMIEAIERYDRECIVGVHGCDLPDEEVSSYYEEGQIDKIHFVRALDRDRPVHLLGTGTVAFWRDLVNVTLGDFPVQNMADVWFARWAQRTETGMIVIRRPRKWLTANPTPDAGIYARNKGEDATQTDVINQVEKWNHHVHIRESS